MFYFFHFSIFPFFLLLLNLVLRVFLFVCWIFAIDSFCVRLIFFIFVPYMKYSFVYMYVYTTCMYVCSIILYQMWGCDAGWTWCGSNCFACWNSFSPLLHFTHCIMRLFKNYCYTTRTNYAIIEATARMLSIICLITVW